MTKLLKTLALVLLALFVCTLAFTAGFVVNQFSARQTSAATTTSASLPPGKFDLMWESWNLVKGEFYYDIPAKSVLVHGMIRGALESLGDPHTVLVEAAPAQQEATNLQGHYGGIGAKVELRKGALVLLPFPEGPATEAGILPGDVIVKIDDQELTAQDTPDGVENKLRGEVGSSVKLTLHRIGATDLLNFEVTRQEINIPTVQYRMLDSTAFGYIQVTLESADTAKEFAAALDALKRDGLKGVVLDLRNNPGGLFPDPALEIVGQFMPGAPVVSEKYRDGTSKTYDARGGGLARDLPVVILVNGGTASAAEIIAGAFNDSGKAVLIGEKTFGKGSVQGLYTLSDESVLHLTTAKWATPLGAEIDGVGITPKIQVPLTPEDSAKGLDPQLDRAVEYLETGK